MRTRFVLAVLFGTTACSFDTGIRISDYNPEGEMTVGPAIFDQGTVAEEVGGFEAQDAREEAARAEDGDMVDQIIEDSAVGGQLAIPF